MEYLDAILFQICAHDKSEQVSFEMDAQNGCVLNKTIIS